MTGKPDRCRGAALLLTLLFLGALFTLTAFFAAMFRLEERRCGLDRQADLLQDGAAAGLAHALALCDALPGNAGLTNRLFTSGWEAGDARVSYSFRIQDQLGADSNLFAGFAPLTAPRLAPPEGGAGAPEFRPRAGLWEGASNVTAFCRRELALGGLPEEQAAPVAAALLDSWDGNREAREPGRGEGLELTGLTAGDSRLLPGAALFRLSEFFDIEISSRELFHGFVIRESRHFYDAARGGTNTLVRLAAAPAGGELKRRWGVFGAVFGLGDCPPDFWRGEATLVSSCGGRHWPVRVLGSSGEELVLEGRPEVELGGYFLRPWHNLREEPGLLSLRRGMGDYWLLTGLCARAEYRFRPLLEDGGELDLRFAAPARACTGGWQVVSADQGGRLFLELPAQGRERGLFALELRQPETLHLKNAGAEPLLLQDWTFLTETPEGLRRELPFAWNRRPLLEPGAELELRSDFLSGAERRLTGLAVPVGWAVPEKVAAVRERTFKEGCGLVLQLETAQGHPRSDRPEKYSPVYLRRPGTAEEYRAFPILDCQGDRLEILLGSRETLARWRPGKGEEILLGDYQTFLHRNCCALQDQWGQRVLLLPNPGRRTGLGYRHVRQPAPPAEALALCAAALDRDRIALPGLLPGTAFQNAGIQRLLLVQEQPQSRPGNFWRGWEVRLPGQAPLRVVASQGAELTLDRPHGVAERAEGFLTPDGGEPRWAFADLPERRLSLPLPREALLPADLYLAGHAPLPGERPAYDVAVYNFAEQAWEPRALGAAFGDQDVLSLGRLSGDHRSPAGRLEIKIAGQGAGARGYWLGDFFCLPDTRCRREAGQRCDSFVVRCRAEVRQGGEAAASEEAWLIQRRWEKGRPRPASFLAARRRL